MGKKAGWMKTAGKVKETLDKMRELGATHEQLNSAEKLIQRYKKVPTNISLEIGGYGAIMLEFTGIVIGIEKDGYAHS